MGSNDIKTAKQKLAEICLYGNKEFVFSSDLSRRAEVIVQVDEAR